MAGGLAVLLGAGLMSSAGPLGVAQAAARTTSACAATDGPTGPGGSSGPTTISTLGQAYDCIFANYYGGSVLDDRTVLVSAFAAFTQELQRRGIDQATATLPALTGDRASDWTAFSETYDKVVGALPDNADLRQALAAAVMQGMISSLHDNHVGWIKGQRTNPLPPGKAFGLGIATLFTGRSPAEISGDNVQEPMYVSAVAPGSPAAKAKVRPGDVIVAIDGVPAFVKGTFNAGIMALLHTAYPQADTLRLTLRRPATGRTRLVGLRPALYPMSATQPSVTLDGNVAKVVLPQFAPELADTVLQDLTNLGKSTKLRGVVFDLRGNGGGRAEAVAKLLGAFVHGKVWSSDCDLKGNCTPNRTDDSTPLLNLPLVLITDSMCASACDAFSAAVKDLELGKLVGGRTAGIVAGLPVAYQLDDGSSLLLMPRHQVAAKGEIIDGVGVAVDYQAPLTAEALSAGHDPGMDKALALLKS
ncbi:PDZ domain-containing protein [Microtetraspora sp. AC03309]|uniref:S41 family peptidase n=1 Tax=Microtetraspora sp. AC03309 TaxID=2779376 RepID=UPI001E4880AA|nr:S41 family peptidase [Microtetraspora sp. AC03309]MCC5578004.1 PDZ domain-containing protein [Microtetraspora sp. AC03309]